MENGKFDPSLPLAFRIADAFGLGIEEVFLLGRRGHRRIEGVTAKPVGAIFGLARIAGAPLLILLIIHGLIEITSCRR